MISTLGSDPLGKNNVVSTHLSPGHCFCRSDRLSTHICCLQAPLGVSWRLLAPPCAPRRPGCTRTRGFQLGSTGSAGSNGSVGSLQGSSVQPGHSPIHPVHRFNRFNRFSRCFTGSLLQPVHSPVHWFTGSLVQLGHSPVYPVHWFTGSTSSLPGFFGSPVQPVQSGHSPILLVHRFTRRFNGSASSFAYSLVHYFTGSTGSLTRSPGSRSTGSQARFIRSRVQPVQPAQPGTTWPGMNTF